MVPLNRCVHVHVTALRTHEWTCKHFLSAYHEPGWVLDIFVHLVLSHLNHSFRAGKEGAKRLVRDGWLPLYGRSLAPLVLLFSHSANKASAL